MDGHHNKKVDFRQAQLLYGRALRTVHGLALRSNEADDPAALLAAAATDLQAAWTLFVEDRERLLEVVRHLARVTVVRTMRARRPRAGPGKVASPATRTRTPRRVSSSPVPASPAARTTTTTAAATAAAPSGSLSPTAASPRRLRRPGRSPATVMGPRVGGTLAVRRKLRFGEGAAADEAGGVAVTALLTRMASHRRSAEHTLAALIQQMELAARPA